jgi:hypothetical protein
LLERHAIVRDLAKIVSCPNIGLSTTAAATTMASAAHAPDAKVQPRTFNP